MTTIYAKEDLTLRRFTEYRTIKKNMYAVITLQTKRSLNQVI